VLSGRLHLGGEHIPVTSFCPDYATTGDGFWFAALQLPRGRQKARRHGVRGFATLFEIRCPQITLMNFG